MSNPPASEPVNSTPVADDSVAHDSVPATPAPAPKPPVLASKSKTKSIFDMLTPVKQPSVATQEPVANETPEQKAQREADEAAAIAAAAKIEEERFKKKFKPAQRERIIARKNAFKKRHKETADKEAADDTADHPDKLTTRTKAIIFSIGPIIAALYILAWAFPAFSAIIAALVIGAAVTNVSYFAYKLYIKGSHTANRINKIAVNFEEDYLPEILEQVEEGLDSFIETTKATTETAVEFSKDLHAIRQNTDTAKDALATVITKFDTLSDDASKKFDKLSGDASKTLTDVSKTVGDVSKTLTNVSKTATDLGFRAEAHATKMTLSARQSRFVGGYTYAIKPVSIAELNSKTKADCTNKKAYIAKISQTELACRFSNDIDVVCNIVIPITDGSRQIGAIATEDSALILDAINTDIVENGTKKMVAKRQIEAAVAEANRAATSAETAATLAAASAEVALARVASLR